MRASNSHDLLAIHVTALYVANFYVDNFHKAAFHATTLNVAISILLLICLESII